MQTIELAGPPCPRPIKLALRRKARAAAVAQRKCLKWGAAYQKTWITSRLGTYMDGYGIRGIRAGFRNGMPSKNPTPFLERAKRGDFGRGFKFLANNGKDIVGQMVSVEIECFVHDVDEFKRALPIAVTACYDGSLSGSKATGTRNAVEVQVPCTLTDFSRLYKVCEIIARFGGVVNKSCGLHVHLDIRDWTPAKAWRPVAAKVKAFSWVVQNVLRWTVPASRTGNTYCKLTDPNPGDRYTAVNAMSVSEHGTVEIRLAAGSTNADKIRLWIETLAFFLRADGKRAKVLIPDACRALDWLFRCNLPPTLKWWNVQRLQKFHPEAIALPSQVSTSFEGSELN